MVQMSCPVSAEMVGGASVVVPVAVLPAAAMMGRCTSTTKAAAEAASSV